jgi:hypothetical protein
MRSAAALITTYTSVQPAGLKKKLIFPISKLKYRKNKMASRPGGNVTNGTLQLVLNSDVALMSISIDMGMDLSQVFVISDGK